MEISIVIVLTGDIPNETNKYGDKVKEWTERFL